MFVIVQQSKDEEDGPDLVGKQYYDTCRRPTFVISYIEYERRFLSNLRSDWLDEVMIGDNSPGTCEWVLDSQPFKTWLSRIEPTLRILGDPGMGKTVLANFFTGNCVKSSRIAQTALPHVDYNRLLLTAQILQNHAIPSHVSST